MTTTLQILLNFIISLIAVVCPDCPVGTVTITTEHEIVSAALPSTQEQIGTPISVMEGFYVFTSDNKHTLLTETETYILVAENDTIFADIQTGDYITAVMTHQTLSLPPQASTIEVGLIHRSDGLAILPTHFDSFYQYGFETEFGEMTPAA